MIIAIEAQRVFRKHKHGMDNVILEIIRQLQKIDLNNEYYIFVNKGDDPCIEPTPNFHIVELDASFYPFWEQYKLPGAVKKVKADILHCTSNTAPLFPPAKLVLTLHDVFFFEPEERANKSMYQKFGRIYRRIVVPRVLPKSKHIVTVSNNAKQSIVDMKLARDENISVIYNSYSDSFRKIEDWKPIVSKYVQSDNYYLFFGNNDPRKNTHRVIQAFGNYLQKSEHKYPLLITGASQEYLNEVLTELNMLDLKSYFIRTGYVPFEDLPYLYNGATAYLNPSLKEGFGIPILEAMACGTVVVTGNTSAMPEVAGDAAILVDPTGCNAITESILQLESPEFPRDTYVQRGFERVKQFSWEKSAREILDVYKLVMKS